MIIKIIFGVLVGMGLMYILLDAFKVPYMKTSKSVKTVSKKQREKTSSVDVWLGGVANTIAKTIKLNEFKRAELEADLKAARLDITPEQYKANAIVKALVIGVFAVPMLFIFPLLSPVIFITAIIVYNSENKKAGKKIKEKRRRIEYELTRFFSGTVLEKNAAYVDINDCPIIKQLLDMGIAEETEKYKVGTLGRYPMWRFTEKFLKACDRRIYREYIKGFDNPLATAPY